MAPSAEAETQGGLRRRVVSALVLAPPVAAAVYFGMPYFELVVALAAVQMAREWERLCSEGGGQARITSVMAGAAVVTLAIARGIGILPAVAAALLSALIVYGTGRRLRVALPAWLAGGMLAIAIPCISFLWLRFEAPAGRTLTLWLLVAVWATDIGAYAAGRTIGGPRLWPRVSPRKTWAGLLGGMASAAAVSMLTAAWLGQDSPWVAGAAGILIGGAAQLGDLAESALKRHFGVKDSGRLIPGHGGLLDRVDGLIATVPAVAVLTWFFGASLVAWR